MASNASGSGRRH